jgi:hypothetical protein
MFLSIFHLLGAKFVIFQDKFIPPEVVVGVVIKITNDFKSEPKNHKKHKPVMPTLIEGNPWGFFDWGQPGESPSFWGWSNVVYLRRSLLQGKICSR